MRVRSYAGRVALLLTFAVADPTSVARADAGAVLGESSRAGALAGAVTARPGDTSAIYFNPAALDGIDRPTLVIFGHLGAHHQSFARLGELGSSETTGIGGWGVSLASPLPGPPWLRRVRLGGALHVPGVEVLRVDVPNRRDVPYSPYYGGRIQRTSMALSLAVALPFRTSIGAGAILYANLAVPTRAGFDPALGATDVDEGVIIEQERAVGVVPSAVLGVRTQPIDELAFGLTWHQGGAATVTGEFEIRAGPIVLPGTLDFYQMIAPEEVTFGVAAFPTPELDLSVDLSWSRWSEFRTIHGYVPDPAFSDTFSVRAGAEWRAHPFLAVRGGYAFEPSPVPEQTGLDNFVDADRHVIGLGVGLDFEQLRRPPFGIDGLPFRIDLALRFHAQHTQEAVKDLSALAMSGDENPGLPGTQIENLGYPGFIARGSFMQLSLTLTIPLGPEVGVGMDE